MNDVAATTSSTSSTSNSAVTAGAVTAPPSQDERISYRGPARRLLISVEVAALIGAIVVWTFLWGNGSTFGSSGATLNWLDSAAPYGIVATAVALLMIGGEFDLSSGVMTGASAMMIGLISRFFMGEGVHIGFAILAAIAAATAMGWFNGYLVVRTGLPSFIITLSSFFIIRGLMLVLSKRLAQKVYVDQIVEQRGGKTFKNWIAHEWRFTDFPIRDKVLFTCAFLGMAMVIYGLLEQSFRRRGTLNPLGLGVMLAGLAVGFGGFAGLHKTDGVSNNYLFGAIGAIGLTIAVVGMGLAGFATHAKASDEKTGPQDASLPNLDDGSFIVSTSTAKSAAGLGLPQRALTRLGLGIASIAAACLFPIPFDRKQRLAVMSWTSPALRPVIAIGAGLVGAALAGYSLRKGAGERIRVAGWIKIALFALYAGALTLALVVATLQMTTVQAVRAVGMMVFGSVGIALLLLARGAAGAVNRLWYVIVGALAAIGLVLIGLVSRADSTATRFREVLPSALTILAALVLANSILEFLLLKRIAANPKADRLARRLQVSGTLLVIVGVAIRLLFTNYTAAQAAARKAAGKPVPQNVLRETVLWWMLVAGVGAYVLAKTKWGNWIFAVGGNRDAARAVGVPADRVKIGLFVTVSFCAALAGTLIALRYGTVQANQGIGYELEYIIAAVIGGCLMTGGYGSVVGTSLGAAILAMSGIGFQTVPDWNADARFAFLGGILLVAVLVNSFIRKKAAAAR